MEELTDAGTFSAKQLASCVREDKTIPASLKTDLLIFIERQADFDLASTAIDEYLKLRGPDALKGMSDRDGVTAHLQAMQRVYKVAPRYDAISALMGAGIRSANDMARVPEEDFLHKFSSTLGIDAARVIYSRAKLLQCNCKDDEENCQSD